MGGRSLLARAHGGGQRRARRPPPAAARRRHTLPRGRRRRPAATVAPGEPLVPEEFREGSVVPCVEGLEAPPRRVAEEAGPVRVELVRAAGVEEEQRRADPVDACAGAGGARGWRRRSACVRDAAGSRREAPRGGRRRRHSVGGTFGRWVDPDELEHPLQPRADVRAGDVLVAEHQHGGGVREEAPPHPHRLHCRRRTPGGRQREEGGASSLPAANASPVLIVSSRVRAAATRGGAAPKIPSTSHSKRRTEMLCVRRKFEAGPPAKLKKVQLDRPKRLTHSCRARRGRSRESASVRERWHPSVTHPGAWDRSRTSRMGSASETIASKLSADTGQRQWRQMESSPGLRPDTRSGRRGPGLRQGGAGLKTRRGRVGTAPRWNPRGEGRLPRDVVNLAREAAVVVVLRRRADCGIAQRNLRGGGWR